MRARRPQSGVTVTASPGPVGSCGRLSTCAHPCLWRRAHQSRERAGTPTGVSGERAGMPTGVSGDRAGTPTEVRRERAGMPTEVSREKRPGRSRKTVLTGPLAVRPCPVTLSPSP